MNRELNLQLAYLADIAVTYRLMVILTSQVRSSPGGNGVDRIEPVATRVLKYWSKNIVRVLTSQRSQVRELMVEKGSEGSAVGSRFSTKLADEGLIETV
jgi:RecA/RadA recombinase